MKLEEIKLAAQSDTIVHSIPSTTPFDEDQSFPLTGHFTHLPSLRGFE